MRRKTSGRLRAYAVEAPPRRTRKVTTFKCRNCAQKVRVEAALWRPAITCPTCQQIIPAPRPERLWLEIVGAILIFLSGVALGSAVHHGRPLPAASTATVVKKEGQALSEPRMPDWFSSEADSP